MKVQRQVGCGNWEPYDDQSGELPVTLKFPTTAEGAPAYTQGNQEWHWTARFEAFVAGAEDQPINTGDRAAPTPPGDVPLRRRRASAARAARSTDYHAHLGGIRGRRRGAGSSPRTSSSSADGTMSFQVGPTSVFDNPVPGCAAGHDRPDRLPGHPRRSGARFIRNQRSASGDGTCDVEWFCFTCTWRPWLDFGDADTAKVTVTLGNGTTEVVDATREGESLGDLTGAAAERDGAGRRPGTCSTPTGTQTRTR